MSETVIEVSNLSKQYKLGLVGTGTISHDINRFVARLRGKEDPYSLVGEVNDRSVKAKSDYVWALNDINFQVKKGEVLGIVGRNGAGKSTLLKILSKVTGPTQGSVKMKGRVGSLLEVGTGFHPELTGRENIYLNGAILGMRKWEITKKLEEIVDFSGVEKYLDTPVKRYSSGMKVRLGFAVAAHLEPEILIVDEVLAVGDAEFQKKCIGKMNQISSEDGRTILLVSHNMASIQSLCSSVITMHNGTLNSVGTDVETEINKYLALCLSSEVSKSKHTFEFGSVENICVNGSNTATTLKIGEKISVSFDIDFNQSFGELEVGLGLSTLSGIGLNTTRKKIVLGKNCYRFTFEMSDIILSSGEYTLHIGLTLNGQGLGYLDSVMSFRVSDVSDQSVLQMTKNLKTSNGVFLNQMHVSYVEVGK